MKIHFIGILGSGMMPLALFLKDLGFLVSGNDDNKNGDFSKLINNGILIFNDEKLYQFILDIDIVVYSSAIQNDNLVLCLSKKNNKAIYSRSELLELIFNRFDDSIGVAGSHGKTTTTAMLAMILKESKNKFTAFIGGDDLHFNGYHFDDDSKILLSEVCEYNRNIKYITPKHSILLNVDNDHLDSYKNLENLQNEFFSYLNRSKNKIVNYDDDKIRQYKNKDVISYSIVNKSNYQAYNVRSDKGRYSFCVKNKLNEEIQIKLKVYGFKNIYNALACVSIADSCFNIDATTIKNALEKFKGVKRRFEKIDKIYNKEIYVDYCHHPTEIESTLNTAKEIFENDYTIIFQPHTYSRTKLLINDFIKVFCSENLFLYKTYSAREKYDYFGSSEYLSTKISSSVYIKDENMLISAIKNSVSNNILVLGAGNIYEIVKSLKNKNSR